MGSVTCSTRLDGALSLQQVRQKIAERASCDSAEMGRGRGFDGVRFEVVTDPKLKTIDDVHARYDDLDKCEGVIVRLTDSTIPYDKRGPLRPFEEALQAEARKVSAFANDLITRLKGQASKTRGCGKCGSSIAVAYLKPSPMREGRPRTTITCAVCGEEDFCVSETDKKRRESLMKAYLKAQERLTVEEARLAATFAKPIWYVFGWNRD
jgi:hypothetical protein